MDRWGNRYCRHELCRDLLPSLAREDVSGSANFAVPSCHERKNSDSKIMSLMSSVTTVKYVYYIFINDSSVCALHIPSLIEWNTGNMITYQPIITWYLCTSALLHIISLTGLNIGNSLLTVSSKHKNQQRRDNFSKRKKKYLYLSSTLYRSSRHILWLSSSQKISANSSNCWVLCLNYTVP